MSARWCSGQCLVVFVALTLGAERPARAESPSQYYVVAVGIDKYPNLSPLSGAVNDAREVAALFKAQGARVVKLLLDEQATLGHIAGALDALWPSFRPKGDVLPGETVVIYLSGHALRHSGHWQFAAYDYTTITKGERGGALDVQTIFIRLMDVLQHGHRVLLIADACNAGQIRHSPEWAHFINKYSHVGDPSAPGGLILLAASAPSQPSWGGEHGRFTQSLLEALQGQADLNQDHKVTFREVSDYLSWRVRELEYYRDKLPGLEWIEQNPVVCATASVPESFVLTRSVTAQPRREHDYNYGKPKKPSDAPGPMIPESDPLMVPGSGYYKSTLIQPPLPLGTWQQITRVISPSGKVFETTYTLEFRKNMTYRAEYQDGQNDPELVLGTYEFRPNQSYGFHLDYGTGVDYLRLDSHTDKQLGLTVYSNPLRHPHPIVLERVAGTH